MSLARGLNLFDDATPRALFSADGGNADGLGLYRYALEWPTGAPGDSMALFALANPSTATHLVADPTVTRCIGYARTWGYGRCGVVNVRAWRETDPKKVPADPLAIGAENDAHIVAMAKRAGIVVCGWGALGGTRGPDVLRLLVGAGITPHALKLTKSGEPGHPLYLKADLTPFAIGGPK